MRRVVSLLLAGALAATVAASADARAPTLEPYLSSMSWPTRAALLRTRTLIGAIDGWLAQGDPPYLGQIAEYCKHFRLVEPRGRLLAILPPPALRSSHAHLLHAYSAVRAGCRHATSTALSTRERIERSRPPATSVAEAALRRATAVPRASLRRFRQGPLRQFEQEVAAWRRAAARELQLQGRPPPRWLDQLG